MIKDQLFTVNFSRLEKKRSKNESTRNSKKVRKYYIHTLGLVTRKICHDEMFLNEEQSRKTINEFLSIIKLHKKFHAAYKVKNKFPYGKSIGFFTDSRARRTPLKMGRGVSVNPMIKFRVQVSVEKHNAVWMI